MISKTILLCGLLSCCLAAVAQQNPVSIKTIKLINEARSNPSAFLKNHPEVAERNALFAKQLAKSKPIDLAIWDPGLVAL